MRLLFDHQLSHKLCRRLADRFPASESLRRLKLDRADDRRVWAYAARQGFTLVTEDADFDDLMERFGPPPRLIRLRCGNQPTGVVEALLRRPEVAVFEADPHQAVLDLT